MRTATALALLMLCSATSCTTTKRAVEALRPDQTSPEHFICDRVGSRPKVPAEYTIDWSKIQTVAQAKAAHEKFVGVLRTRENIVAGYIVVLESVNFVCFNSIQWQRDYYAGLGQAKPPR